ncbi:MAG: CoA transferase [Acidimicrobiia bacterium]|nr:CoA transferase [Acidimicrobiia bacterium]MDH4308685.1 CoA transferase [Acidimicrobiia bacterium]
MVEPAAGPLRGVRVLDIATMLGAGHCSSLLADFGAEVIHVELPGRGDSLRGMGPFANGRSLRWAVVGRGKKSITCDLHTTEGQDLVRRLVEVSDVVVENYRPGTIAKWRLGYDELSALNPGVILLSLSGYGQTGPKSHLPGFGRVIEAASGLMNQTGEPDGPPFQMGVPLVDYIAGTFGAMAVSMALYDRSANGGTGQWIDLSLYESVVRLLDSLITREDVLGETPTRMGNRYVNVAPSDVFQTRDGKYVFHSSATHTVYTRLMNAIGRPDLIEDERYATNSARTARGGDINDIVQAWFSQHDLAQAMEVMDRYDVPCSPVNTMTEVIADPQLLERDGLIRRMYAGVGEVLMPGVIPRLSTTPGGVRHAGPEVGEHTTEVLSGLLGLSEEEIARLGEQGVI